MDYEALKAKYNAEEVGDRLIAEVNGQRQYIADKTVGGGFALTPHGEILVGQITDAVTAEEKPKRKKKEAAESTTADDDLLAGLDDAPAAE